MNIRKGFFRLTLVLSILIGAIVPFCHEWIFDEKNKFNIFLPDDWEKKSLQERLNSIDGFLLTKKSLKAKIEELNIRRQLRETIISDVKSPAETPVEKVAKLVVKGQEVPLEMIPKELINEFGYFFSFKIGWRELSLLAFVGFASPWLIYLFIRWVIIAFIFGGFRDKTKVIGG